MTLAIFKALGANIFLMWEHSQIFGRLSVGQSIGKRSAIILIEFICSIRPVDNILCYLTGIGIAILADPCLGIQV